MCFGSTVPPPGSQPSSPDWPGQRGPGSTGLGPLAPPRVEWPLGELLGLRGLSPASEAFPIHPPWRCLPVALVTSSRRPHWGTLPLALPALPSAALCAQALAAAAARLRPPFWWRGARQPPRGPYPSWKELLCLFQETGWDWSLGNGLGLLKARVVSSGKVTETSQSFPRFCLNAMGEHSSPLIF